MKIKANGIQINYELSGKDGAPVLMLSHSLGSSLVMWNPQMTALATRYRVLRFDTRGHGGSDAPKGAYTLDQLARDAIGLMNALSLDKVHWVGLSMGGMIGQCLALDYTDRLLSLALCDTSAFVPEESQPVWQERINTALDKGMKPMLDSTMERWFTAPYINENHPEVDIISRQYLATPVSGFIGCCEAIRHLNYLERLSEITIPTLIIVGEEDQGTPVEASEVMHERIPESRLVVLKSAAHLSNIEQSEAFNNALLGFLHDI